MRASICAVRGPLYYGVQFAIDQRGIFLGFMNPRLRHLKKNGW